MILKEIDKIWQNISASEILKYCLEMPYRFRNNIFHFAFEPNDLENFMYRIGGEIDFLKIC